MSDDASPLDRFLAQYWKDHEADAVRSLDEYLAMFPGDAAAVASEFLALEAKARTERSEDENSIGPYRTIKEIGRGGQGVVYLAEDTRFGRTVALKVLTYVGPLGEAVLTRFPPESSRDLRRARCRDRKRRPLHRNALPQGQDPGGADPGVEAGRD